jgi:MFS family permease
MKRIDGPIGGRIFLYGFAHAFLSAVFLSHAGFYTGFESVAIANSIAATGRFANPFAALPTGLTAHSAPLYPALMGLILRIYDSRFFLATVMTLLSALLFGILLSLLPALGERLFNSRKTGTRAAWIAILLPVFGIEPESESIALAAVLAAFCLVSAGTGRTVLCGVLGGIGVLLSPTAAPLIGVWLLGLVFLRRRNGRDVLACSLIVFTMCLPWCMRNLRELGSFTLRDNFSLELQVHNNDLAQPAFADNLQALRTLHPNLNVREAERLRDSGEVAYSREKRSEALTWIASHTRRFAYLTSVRLILFWFPDRKELPFAPIVWVLSVLAIPAVFSAFRTGPGMLGLLALSLLAYSLVYGLVASDFRYSQPVLWGLLLFSSETIERWRLCQITVQHGRYLAASEDSVTERTKTTDMLSV